MTTANDTDVLIVGAGPVGLFLANECARRGLGWRLVEARNAQSEYSKALAIFPRTLEIFDMAGVVGPFLEAANRVTSVAVWTHDRQLAQVRFNPEGTPYPFVAMVPQNITENLLLQELRRKDGRVEYQTEFVSAEQHDGFVTAHLNHQGDATTVRASVVVGCDGSRSNVRKTMNIALVGGDYDTPFLLADVDTNDAFPGDEMQLCPSRFGPAAIFPMSATRRRIVASIERPEGESPTLELVQRILNERAPKGIQALALHWSSYFRIHHRHAPQLRQGRLFIAGDAAHIHSPFGGQGMNTGLHDVWNVVWKLDLFERGHGSSSLLDSYAAERIPIIENVIETTDTMTKVLGSPNKVAELLRNALIPGLAHLPAFQHGMVERLSGLGIAYSNSPIGEGSGARHFEESMRGGGGVGSRFLLLTNSEGEASASDAVRRLCGDFPNVLEARTSREKGVKLVRPDGYLAYETRSESSDALEPVRSILSRLTA